MEYFLDVYRTDQLRSRIFQVWKRGCVKITTRDSLAKDHGQGKFYFRHRKGLSNAVPVRGRKKILCPAKNFVKVINTKQEAKRVAVPRGTIHQQ